MADSALASLQTLPARFRWRLARRLVGAALAAQAGEWWCLGGVPVLLVMHLAAWPSLFLVAGTFVGASGLGVASASLWPPTALRLRELALLLGLLSGGAFLLLLVPSPTLRGLVLALTGICAGWVQATAWHLRTWVADGFGTPTSVSWSWLVALGGCTLTGILIWSGGWHVPIWLSAWSLLLAGYLLLRVPQPPLDPTPLSRGWRASIAQAWHVLQELWPLSLTDDAALASSAVSLLVQTTVPALAIVATHATWLVALGLLGGIQLALLLGMQISETVVGGIQARWPRITTQILHATLCCLVPLLVGLGMATGLPYVVLLGILTLGVLRSVLRPASTDIPLSRQGMLHAGALVVSGVLLLCAVLADYIEVGLLSGMLLLIAGGVAALVLPTPEHP